MKRLQASTFRLIHPIVVIALKNFTIKTIMSDGQSCATDRVETSTFVSLS